MFSRKKKTRPNGDSLKCAAVVVANGTADIEGVAGFGKPYLVSCPACVERSLYAASHEQVADMEADAYQKPFWHGVGETYADSESLALDLARAHNQRSRSE